MSRDGKRIAFVRAEKNESAVWVQDLSREEAARRLTFGGRDRYPVWSHDGQSVIFQSDREGDAGMFWQRADRVDRDDPEWRRRAAQRQWMRHWPGKLSG